MANHSPSARSAAAAESESAQESQKTLSPVLSPIAYPYPLHDEKRLPILTAASDCHTRFSFHDQELAFVENKLPCISWKELKIQCSLAWPLILGNLLSFLLQLVSTSFVGHTGVLELSGASLAYSFSVVTGYSLLFGMSNALETLCGQAFGAGEYQKLGVYIQRSIVVRNMVSVPLAILWVYIEHIFLALGQDAQLASKAGAYGVWLIPSLFAVSCYTPLAKFLQAQSLVIPLFVCFTIALVCHVPICWALVFHTSLGYKGAALANSISLWITVLALTLYVKFSPKCAACRAPVSSAALQDLGSFLKLAIPSAMMMWGYKGCRKATSWSLHESSLFLYCWTTNRLSSSICSPSRRKGPLDGVDCGHICSICCLCGAHLFHGLGKRG